MHDNKKLNKNQLDSFPIMLLEYFTNFIQFRLVRHLSNIIYPPILCTVKNLIPLDFIFLYWISIKQKKKNSVKWQKTY